MKRAKNLTGKRFGKLKVFEDSGIRTSHGRVMWCCKCDCGNETLVRSDSLLGGDTQSCGCLRGRAIVHGCASRIGQPTAEYRAWCEMKSRCYDSNLREYPQYGGRGITVCERWKNSFVEFLKDMGLKPTSKHTIERIDNLGSYFPENCKWATYKEQNRNKRNNHLVTYNGKTLCIAAWAEYLNISASVLSGKLRHRQRKGLTEIGVIADLQKDISR